jgi:hypothetical protein
MAGRITIKKPSGEAAFGSQLESRASYTDEKFLVTKPEDLVEASVSIRIKGLLYR